MHNFLQHYKLYYFINVVLFFIIYKIIM